MNKETFKKADDLLKNRQNVSKMLNQISKSSGKDFAFFDENNAKFVSDSMEIMQKISNLLDNLGIKYTHKSANLKSVPELIIAPEYVEVAHKLFDGWKSNVVIQLNTRIENIDLLLDKDR